MSSVKRARFSGSLDINQQETLSGKQTAQRPAEAAVRSLSPPTVVTAASGRINCLKALYFHPVITVDDFKSPKVHFGPLYVHHFFGLKEEIYGFSELCIQIFYIVDTLELFVKVNATRLTSSSSITDSSAASVTSSRSSSENETPELTRILSHLEKVPFPGGIHRVESSFLQAINSSSSTFKPPGHLVASFSNTNQAGAKVGDQCLELYACKFNDDDDSSIVSQTSDENLFFHQYHRRVEWLMHFFIDACSSIDRDNNWSILLLFNRTNKHLSSYTDSEYLVSQNSTKASYELCGVVTLYTFFSLPLSRRRVSQFFIFPHYQGQGLGLKILLHVYREAIKDCKIKEITVEDPAKSFAQLRDLTGLLLAIEGEAVSIEDFHFKVPSFQNNYNFKTGVKENDKNKNPERNEDNDLLKQKLKGTTKESARQISRLIEIINVAKALQQLGSIGCPELFGTSIDAGKTSTPKIEEQQSIALHTTRDWRTPGAKDWESLRQYFKAVSISNHLKTLRVQIKKRIRFDDIENLANSSHEEQRLSLEKSWEETFLNYCRVILRVCKKNPKTKSSGVTNS